MFRHGWALRSLRSFKKVCDSILWGHPKKRPHSLLCSTVRWESGHLATHWERLPRLNKTTWTAGHSELHALFPDTLVRVARIMRYQQWWQRWRRRHAMPIPSARVQLGHPIRLEGVNNTNDHSPDVFGKTVNGTRLIRTRSSNRRRSRCILREFCCPPGDARRLRAPHFRWRYTMNCTLRRERG